MSLTVEVAGKTDVGCIRKNNEDNLGYDARYGVYLVCDGMGGQAAGEVASKMAIDCVLTYFREAAKTDVYPQIGEVVDGVSDRANRLGSAIRLANEAIYQAAQGHAAQSGMGSTIVAAQVEEAFVAIGHAGDSRIYLIRNGAIQQLTHDHSLVMEQVRRGLLTREEAEKSEMQNIIIKALGPEEDVDPDVDDQMAQPGDILLLATDGLTKLVNDQKLLEIVQSTGSLKAACDQLIEAAKQAGGDDNITCMLLRIERSPWYKQCLKRLFSGGGDQWLSSS